MGKVCIFFLLVLLLISNSIASPSDDARFSAYIMAVYLVTCMYLLQSGNPSPVMEAVNTESDNTDLEPVIFRSVCSVCVTMYKFEFRKRTITCL